MLELKNVSKFYYKKGIVSSGISKVSLKFDMGEFIAITGESGSGKSTLLNVISGLDTYEEGEMYVNGEETSHYNEEDYEEYRKKYIGNIFQSFNLVNSYTVYQNVELVLLINGEIRRSVKHKVIDILKKVDLYKYRHTKVSKLSGGMKQRVAIARCLAKDTPIIIADEPTGNLDSKNAKSVLKLLYEISKYKLVIVVTHNFEQISEYATRRITMHDGSVIEDMKLKDKNEVKEVNTSKFKKTKVISNLRLGIRNTFNIVPKFLLLTFVYLFVLISIVGVYSAFLELESTNNAYNSFFNETDANKRVIVKKKDNSSFTNEEINKLKSISNVEKVITNDYVYDYSMSLIDYENIFLDSNFMKLEEFKGKLKYGRMPLNDNEIIVSGSKENYYIEDMGSELINKEVSINSGSDEIKVKIVGVSVFDKYNWMVTSYVSDKIYNYVENKVEQVYGTTKVFISDNSQNVNPNIKTSDILSEGQVYISENYSYNCKSYNCMKDSLNIKFSNMYTNKEISLSNVKVYNKNNFKKIFGSEYDDMDTIYLSSNDYDKLYKNNNIYQVSLFVKDVRNIDKTMNELNDYVSFSLNSVKQDGALIQVIKIVKTIIITVLVIVLFFVSYFVIKLIIKSRNKYFTTIRILGGSYIEVKRLLQIELLNVTNIVYLVFLIISLLIKNDIIVSESIKSMLFYINLKEYVIVYLILSLMSYLTSSRYSRKIFKRSVITTYNEEV
jgi:putative ABC transport system permease protein